MIWAGIRQIKLDKNAELENKAKGGQVLVLPCSKPKFG